MWTRLPLKSTLPTFRCSRTTSPASVTSTSTATKLRITLPTAALLPLTPVDLDLTQIALPLILLVSDPKSLDLELVVWARAFLTRASVLNTINSDQILLHSVCLRASSTDLTEPISAPATPAEDSLLLPRDSLPPLQASSDLQSASTDLLKGNHTVLPRDRHTDLVPSITALSSPPPRLTTLLHLEVPPPMADPLTAEETPCPGELLVTYEPQISP